MKRIFAIGAALSMSASVFATDVQLVVEKVDNQGASFYHTWLCRRDRQHSLGYWI
jgi:hypothetical protein